MAYVEADPKEGPRLRLDPRKIQILGFWCMIKKDPTPDEKVLKCGLFAPTIKSKPKKSGIVVDRGNNFTEETNLIQVGDRVQYSGFVRCCFGWEADTYEIIDSEDIIGVFGGKTNDARGKESDGEVNGVCGVALGTDSCSMHTGGR